MSEPERSRLATAMARDVFAVVAKFDEAARFVVSDDPDVLAEGRQFGLEPVEDRAGQGQSAAVGQGFTLAWERGFPVALTIPGDVPGITISELRRFSDYRREIEVLLAPDRGRIGTNGLRLAPPHAISLAFEARDVVLITQKVTSKAEGQARRLDAVRPSARAKEIASRIAYDPRHVEVILSESVRVVREAPRVLITETRHGFVCANAGVDRSNTGGKELVILLPEHPDESAHRLRESLGESSGSSIGVVISDSFGRPW